MLEKIDFYEKAIDFAVYIFHAIATFILIKNPSFFYCSDYPKGRNHVNESSVLFLLSRSTMHNFLKLIFFKT